jgi:MerR family transcriptional regulator, copper efflux regulator
MISRTHGHPAPARREARAPGGSAEASGGPRGTHTSTMRIGELARRAGVNVQTVRYYERRGLLHDPRGRGDGYREYTEATIARLRFIRRAQELGFTLAEIDELLTLRLDPGTTADEVRSRAEAKIAEVEAKIRDLERIRHALGHLAGQCHGGHGPVGDCPFLDELGPIDRIAVEAR